MQGKAAPNPEQAAAIRAHLALLRLQRDTLQTVIDVLEEDLNPQPPRISAPAPVPRPTITARHALELPRAA